MSSKATPAQVQAYLQAAKAIADCVKELGAVPSGHLYAHVMGHMSLETYQGIIDKLKQIGFVSESSHLLTWTGPK